MCGGVLMMIQRENMREKIKGINFFFSIIVTLKINIVDRKMRVSEINKVV